MDTVQVLLFVAANPLSSMGEIGKALGQPSSTTSRQLLDLGLRDRHLREGLGLVEPVGDAIDMRVKRFRLTPKGRTLLDAMLKELR